MEEPNNFQLATATCNESRQCAYGLHGYTNVEVRSIILYVVRKQSILNAKCQKFHAPIMRDLSHMMKDEMKTATPVFV